MLYDDVNNNKNNFSPTLIYRYISTESKGGN